MFSKIYVWFKSLCSNNTIDEQEKERLADKLMLEHLKELCKIYRKELNLKK
jgi:hypothetical protein